jgi:Zn-dependent protease with chaperone function
VVQLCVILAIAALVIARDPQFAASLPEPHLVGIIASLGAMLGLVATVWLHAAWADGHMTRAATTKPLRSARFFGEAALFALTSVQVFMTLALGWPTFIQQSLGHPIVIGHVIALTPLLLSILALWWAQWPLQRRIWEAMLIRRLDQGHSIEPLPTRVQAVWQRTRHDLLPALLPLAILTAWHALVTHAIIPRVEAIWSPTADRLSTIAMILQVLGVIAVVLAIPALLARLWNTVPLGPGPLAQRLATLAAAAQVRGGDRVRIWQTGGTLLNGAVMGTFGGPGGRFRAVLLTDALVEQLPQRELEAVVAHELGHVRRRHIPWLMAATAAAGLAMTVLASLALVAALVVMPQVITPLVGELIITGAAFTNAILTFGFVSRRFEHQADAFAAVLLSRVAPKDPDALAPADTPRPTAPTAPPAPPALPIVRTEATDAMIAALWTVSESQGIDPERFTFRHGSIAARIRHLHRLSGQRIDRLPIDQTALLIRIATLAVLLTIGIAWLAGWITLA